jgi:hypothetical protein
MKTTTRRTAAGPPRPGAGIAGAAAFLAAIRQTAPPNMTPFLPIHDQTFVKCSTIIATSLRHLDHHRALPLPSAMLPPPM